LPTAPERIQTLVLTPVFDLPTAKGGLYYGYQFEKQHWNNNAVATPTLAPWTF
jgi:hypothetical protein